MGGSEDREETILCESGGFLCKNRECDIWKCWRRINKVFIIMLRQADKFLISQSQTTPSPCETSDVRKPTPPP